MCEKEVLTEAGGQLSAQAFNFKSFFFVSQIWIFLMAICFVFILGS